MSYMISAYSASIEKVQKAFGSHDSALAASLKKRFTSRFEQDAAEKDEDYDEEPSLEQALEEIIDGKALQAGFGHKYGWVLEMLCNHFGALLPNECYWGMRSAWAEEVEEALGRAGIPPDQFSLLNHLMYRGSPVKIPTPDDFPAIGYMKVSELPLALRAIEAANLSSLDEEHKRAVLELRNWLEACLNAQSDLICFYG